MGQTRAAVIQYMNTKCCFVNIPINWRYSMHSEQIVVFEVKYGGGKCAFFSWSGNNVLKKEFSTNDIIEVNNVYANKLGIKHGEEVLVKEVLSVPSIHQVWMEPISDDDWEILELNTETVKWQLLNQIRVVWKGQILPVWINKSVLLYLIVTQISSSSELGKLEQFTELYIKPKFRVSGINLNDASGTLSAQSLTCDSKVVDKISDGNSHLKLKYNPEGYLKQTTSYSSSGESTQSILNESSFETIGVHESRSVLGKLSNYIFGLGSQTTTSLMKDTAKTIEELKLKARLKEYWANNIQFSSSLRVSPMPKFENNESPCDSISSHQPSVDSETSLYNNSIDFHNVCLLSKQPTTVFIKSPSLSLENLTNEMKAPVFLGVMCKILSPTEKSEITSKKNNQQNSKGLVSVSKTDFITDRVYVKVVVIDKINVKCQKNCKKIKSSLLHYLGPGKILIPDALRCSLNLEIGCKVHLRSKYTDILTVQKISACLLGDRIVDVDRLTWMENLTSTLNSLTADSCPLVINSENLIPIQISDTERNVVIAPLDYNQNDEKPFQLLPLTSKQSIIEKPRNVLLGSGKTLPSITELDLYTVGFKKYALGGMNEILEDGLKYLKVALNLSLIVDGIVEDGVNCSGALPGALAIVGPRGSGRTTVAKCLCRELSDAPYFVYTEISDCKQLRGKRPETMYKIWKKMFFQAVHKAPSIILFDDLDHVAGTSSADRTAVDVIQEQVAQIIADLWKTVAPPNSPVVFLITCASKESLNSILFSARGCHIIQKFLTIPSLNLERRINIVKSLLSSRCSNECINKLNISKVVSTIEGVTVQDLKTLVDKAVYSACRKTENLSSSTTTDLIVTKDDFLWALDGFIPASLKDIKKSIISKGWNDIGGLTEVKKILEETFLWPTKFPHLFAQCPIRLSSGLLLYGPPGTGKTLLAAAVATECSLNFISIKGPELLSKYIGASEQAVRDLFRKADSAKPSIVFFDEFDAIAPRRGHDSTGVTDRVVNQLLTQMDGIEERTDIYILAATSRPDLIDPALLRPGRLDKCIHCPLPTQEEQLDILSVLSRPLTLAPDVDWPAVVNACEHFSGADLQALLFNAQLLAIHQWEEEEKRDLEARRENENTEKNAGDSDKKAGSLSWVYMSNLEEGAVDSLPPERKETLQEEIEVIVNNNIMNSQQSSSSGGQLAKWRPSEKQVEPSIAMVTQNHLMHAAQQMKPSVSPEERQRYKLIYDAFVLSKASDFSTVTPTVAKKATLA